MSDFNREAHCKTIHEKRKKQTDQRVENALKELVKSNSKITFGAVALKSCVSISTLYKNPKYKKSIETLRLNNPSTTAPKKLRISENPEDKDAMIESLKRRINKLEEENKKLKTRLGDKLSDTYNNL